MKVYELLNGHNQNLEFVSLKDMSVFFGFRGSSVKHTWRPIEVRVVPATAERPSVDSPYLIPGTPVLSRRAVDLLGPVLTGSGELLPLACTTGEYFAFNVLNVVDALDESSSGIERREGGGISKISKHVFFKEKLVGARVFKIPQDTVAAVYAADEFVEAVAALGITGFDFRPVWSSV